MANTEFAAETIAERVALNTKEVLNFNEACAYTGLSKSAMYKLTCYKQVPHYKPTGKLVFFNRRELEAWLQQNRVASEQELTAQVLDYCHWRTANVSMNRK